MAMGGVWPWVIDIVDVWDHIILLHVGIPTTKSM